MGSAVKGQPKMIFRPLASSSAGNAYVVESPGSPPLLLEAGISVRRLRETLNFGLSGLAGCLVSHSHGDHSKGVKDLLKAGVDCWMSKGTAEALEVQGHHRLNILRAYEGANVGDWGIMPFPVEHDADEALGFLVGHIDAGYTDRLLFVPDTAFVRNRFEGVNLIAIECNFDPDRLSRNVQAGLHPSVAHRVRRMHMSLDTVIAMLKANDLSKTRAIYLLHLSSGNSDEARMIRSVEEATGIPTYSCDE